MNMYSYDGLIIEFDNYVANRWVASTRAVSEKEAGSDLTCQFKKKNSRLPGTEIISPGKVNSVSGRGTTWWGNISRIPANQRGGRKILLPKNV